MLMTQQELYELTDYQIAAKQIEWLHSHGWLYEIGASGRPKVSRMYFEQRMGVVAQEVLPDFSSLAA